MKAIFLTGNDIDKIDKRSTELTTSAILKNYKIINVSEELTLFEALKNNDLFQEKKLIIVPRFSLLEKKDFNYLEKINNDTNTVIVVKNENSLAASKLKSFGKDTKVEIYNLPKVIWNFLDSLRRGNSAKSLLLLHSVSESEPIELVFYLMSQRFIQLYLAKVSPSGLKSPSWQVTKLQNQAEHFSENDLKKIISNLSQIDVDYKTGNGELKTLIDLFIISNLE